MNEINWSKTGADGSDMTAVSNDRPASIAAMESGGWKQADKKPASQEKSIEELLAMSPDDLSVPELKAVFKHLDVEYPGKKADAVEYLKNK